MTSVTEPAQKVAEPGPRRRPPVTGMQLPMKRMAVALPPVMRVMRAKKAKRLARKASATRSTDPLRRRSQSSKVELTARGAMTGTRAGAPIRGAKSVAALKLAMPTNSVPPSERTRARSAREALASAGPAIPSSIHSQRLFPWRVSDSAPSTKSLAPRARRDAWRLCHVRDARAAPSTGSATPDT
jgi:hypothetical protein